MPANRTKTGQFKKGASGNPRGRPKVADEIKDMFTKATPEAVKLLVDTMNNDEVKPELRVSCANTIIDRVLGKASQPIEHSGNIDNGKFEVNIKVIE